MDKNISFTLKVWRQKGPKAKGAFETYQMKDIPGDTSFLEMLDILNEQLISEGKEPRTEASAHGHLCLLGWGRKGIARLKILCTKLSFHQPGERLSQFRHDRP